MKTTNQRNKDTHIINNVGWIGLILTILIQILTSTTTQAQTIYEVEYKSQSNIVLYKTQYKSQATYKYYIVQYRSKANTSKHHWYIVQYESQAELKVWWTEYPNQADHKVYEVNYPSETL
jgi:hypothetical protein